MLRWRWKLLCSFLSDYPSSVCWNGVVGELDVFSSVSRRSSLQTSEMDSLTVAELTGLGITLGIVHVLSGPDHISAMVTLSAGGSFRAFWKGVQWGLGHSGGLLLMFGVFRIFDEKIDFDQVGQYADIIVGLLMILLGTYGSWRAWKLHRSETDHLGHQELKELYDVVVDSSSSNLQENPEQDCKSDTFLSDATKSNSLLSVSATEITIDNNDYPPEQLSSHKKAEKHSILRTLRAVGSKSVSLVVGLVHGLAGPGGILGVLPAVALRDSLKSGFYLGSFCIASILIMGIFCAFWGEITARVSSSNRVQVWIIFLSSLSSFVVGVLWLVLVATGKMNLIA
mmetsp:Transcript_4081/g.15103  ORF Transcript_4081/g.15103 Transcript_4081/m.15103 type:complete len:340 (-) Transcript_4081:129-1148(-)